MDSVDGLSSEPFLHDSTPATCALNERVALNIGGTLYRTTRGTLCRCEGSMLERMFNRSPDDPLRAVADSSGQYFIDRDGPLFRHILNYLRDGRLAIAFDFSDYDQLIAEADFYGGYLSTAQLSSLFVNDIWIPLSFDNVDMGRLWNMIMT